MKEALRNHQFKITVITAISVIIAVAGMSWRASERLSDIETQHILLRTELKAVEEQGVKNKDHIMTVEDEQNQADLDRIKIITKLENIELAIIDLKLSLKEHDLN